MYKKEDPRVQQIINLMDKSVKEVCQITGLSKSSIYELRSVAGISKSIYQRTYEERNRDGLRFCPTCKQWLDLETWFRTHAKSPGGRNTYCRTCENKRKRKTHLQRTYGLSEEDSNKLLERANKVCEICRKQDQLVIDHCHDTNKVRGLLCHKCNLGIGHFQDSPALLREAIKYLEEGVIRPNPLGGVT